MKIKTLILEDINGIKSLSINFYKGINIICGANGIGKTTILESICHALNGGRNSHTVKKRFSTEYGVISLNFQDILDDKYINLKVNSFDPQENTNSYSKYDEIHDDNIKEIFSIKDLRQLPYQEINHVSKDENRQRHDIHNQLMYGLDTSNIKSWFINRYLYSAHKNSLTDSQQKNFELAKAMFTVIDPNLKFLYSKANNMEIMLDEGGNEIYMEYLSSGYKSIISIIFGLLKEIEFRFPEKEINLKEFEGVILIDEICNHLHPIWQVKIVNILADFLPNAQFIMTTHSPHVLQSLEQGHVIALDYDQNHNVIQNHHDLSNHLCAGWTIDEILRYIMKFTDFKSKLLVNAEHELEKALSGEKCEDVDDAREKLNLILHPMNAIREIIQDKVYKWKQNHNC